MEKLKYLNKINDYEIYSVEDEEFKEFGKIIKNYNFSSIETLVERETEIPENGNIYVGSWKKGEDLEIYNEVKNGLYGGMDIQIGYCNGKNSKLNGLEYHKGSEINVAVTDFVLFLGNTNNILEGEIKSEKIKAFYIKKGEAIEIYQTTMHFAPCKVDEKGFKSIVILPRGTNTDIDIKNKIIKTQEDNYLFKKNKWLLVHEDKGDLIEKGAYNGIIGTNLELKY